MVGVGIDMWKKVGEGIRYPFYILAVVALLLFSGLAHAEDNSKWCGLMVAIYGVCSPQLIDNYLVKTSEVVKPTSTKVVPNVPTSFNEPQLVKSAQKPPDEKKLLCLEKLYAGKKTRFTLDWEGKPYVVIYEPSSDVWRKARGC